MSTSLERELGLDRGPGIGRTLGDFLFPAPARRSAGSILAWWEWRRPAYNLIVGGTGVFSLSAMILLAWLPPGGLWAGFPPWQAVVGYGILANVCYTAGSAVEILVHRLWGRQLLPVGPALFRIGLTVSVGITLAPVLLMLIFWMARVVGLA